MARRYRPGRRKGRGGLGWSVALGVLLLGVGSGGAGLALFLQSRPQIDAQTLCPVDGPTAREVIILDLTDPLTDVQARHLHAAIADRLEAAGTGTLFALAVVQADLDGPQFARCKPQSGQSANALYQNPKLLAATFAEGFEQPLDRVLSAAMEGAPQAKSPLLETLQDTLSRLPPSQGPTHVLLVSDLLQNSALLSVYRGESWETFATAGLGTRLSGALAGAQIHIVRLPRPEAGRAAHLAADGFWGRYFDAQGVARPPRVTVLGDL